MPVRKLGGIVRGLNAVRQRAPKNLPADIDSRLAEIISSVGKMPRLPLKERQDLARKQRDELSALRCVVLDLVEQGAFAMAQAAPMPDVMGAIDGAIGALSDVISGIDIDIPL